MKLRKTHRMYFILLVLGSLAVAVGLSLYALKDTISFFYTPVQVKAFQQEGSPRVAAGKPFRLGGMVQEGSLQRGKTVRFIVTDMQEEMTVVYEGMLPDLFREGQGVVAKGSVNAQGVFVAEEILAKHDENYMPPEVAKALEQAP